jgi:glycosyltransferase involved in cell wall biosynthesis
VSDGRAVRVGLDLSGSLAPLGNTMNALAGALRDAGVHLVTFATARGDDSPTDVALRGRWLLAPLWTRGRGPRVDQSLHGVDIVHVAGPAVPPTGPVPLMVSVDDLRPLRDDDGGVRRVRALQRAVARGARLVTTSHAARHEVLDALHLELEDVVIAHPAVPTRPPVVDGTRLVVSVTGTVDVCLQLAPSLVAMARRCGVAVDVLTSPSAATRLAGIDGITLVPRREAARALERASAVLLLSDGARFPSLAVAAMAAGVPTAATRTPANDELLGEAADLVALDDLAGLVDTAESLLVDEGRRRLLTAAGRDRARDFAPEVAANRYASLYRALVAGRTS